MAEQKENKTIIEKTILVAPKLAISEHDKVPANWEIVPIGDDQIEARNLVTGNFVQGTIADLNKILRG